MSIGRTNAGSGGTGGTLTVTAPAGVTVTVSKDGKTKARTAGASGVVTFKGLGSGVWTVTITGDGKTAQKAVAITTDYSTAISFNAIPEFTYTGDFEIVSDDDQPITVSQDNFKIRFLTSGTLIFKSLNGAEGGIDIFLVGGGAAGNYSWRGAGGGGGGYTHTALAVHVQVGVEYEIVIGAGGIGEKKAGGKAGGVTSAFGITANGGDALASNGTYGGNGGSGGGSGKLDADKDGAYASAGVGGTDGASGTGTYPGTGQGTTTREFGESGGTLYASGGDGAQSSPAAEAANTGNGGDGGAGNNASGSGGSGIVIIRNAREAA